MANIAIIGAGLSGIVVARDLHAHHDVTVFEKSRGTGGRMATRYADPYRFDHGAQFFTARSRRFRDFLAPLIDAGCVAIWEARFAEMTRSECTARRTWDENHPHYVGVPGMNAIVKWLAEDLDVRSNCRVTSAERTGDGWQLELDGGREHATFDWLVCSQPAEQTAALVGPDSKLGELASATTMKACFALMLGFEQPLATDFDAARVLDADISWISVNSSKPGRADAFTIVVHATNKWADQNVELDEAKVDRHLAEELEAVAGIDAGAAEVRQLHRWLYANADKRDGEPCFFDEDQRLAACGDWFIRGRVEAAFRSASALSDQLLTVLQG